MTDSIIRLTGNVEIQAAAGDQARAPRVAIVAYSGGEMAPPGWPPLVIDLSGADVAGDIPILAGHGEDLDSIAGQGKAEVRNHQLHVQGTLTDATASGQKVLALARGGVNLQASVGFSPGKREYVSSGQTVRVNGRSFTAGDRGLTIIRAGKLREVSLLPIGADPGSSVSISAKGTTRMANETTTDTDPRNPEVPDELKAAWDRPGLTDLERVQARWAGTTWYDADPAVGPRARAEKAMIAAAAGRITYADFDRTMLVEKCRDAELRAMHAERPIGPAIHGSRRDLPGGVNADMILAAAALTYFGRDKIGEKAFGATAMEAARGLGLRSVYDLARFALHQAGRETPVGGEAMLKAAFSTTNLPTVLGDSASKIARAAFEELPATWRTWCDVIPVTDFKQKTLLRVGHTLGLEELPPSGEIKHGYLAESTANVKAATYARMLAVPRQLLVNDDLGLIPQVAGDFGKLAIRKVANLIYTALLANGGSFFSEANGNLIDNPLSAAGLAAALLAFRSQVDADGEPIDIRPAVLVVPPSLESTGRQLLNSEALQRYVADGTDNAPMGNPFANLNLTLEVEPRLEAESYTGASSTAWYLVGPPSAQAAVVAFLNGQQGPTVEQTDTDFNTLGQQWRCFIDVGAALVDPKAAVKSSGDGAE